MTWRNEFKCLDARSLVNLTEFPSVFCRYHCKSPTSLGHNYHNARTQSHERKHQTNMNVESMTPKLMAVIFPLRILHSRYNVSQPSTLNASDNPRQSHRLATRLHYLATARRFCLPWRCAKIVRRLIVIKATKLSNSRSRPEGRVYVSQSHDLPQISISSWISPILFWNYRKI